MTAIHVYGFTACDGDFNGEETIVIKETTLDFNNLHYVVSRIIRWGKLNMMYVEPFWHFA